MKTILIELISSSLAKIVPKDSKFPEVSVEVPKNTLYGDYSTNAPLLLARFQKQPPFQIAEALVQELGKDKHATSLFSEIKPEKNGFINFKIKQDFLQNNLKTIRKQNLNYGRSTVGANKKVLIEFVSANPTGPLHVGHGRWAVIGDDIASLLDACGYNVQREFYVNDIGNQIKKLEESVNSFLLKLPLPADGYGGSYVQELSKKIEPKKDDPNFSKIILSSILADQKESLNKLRVEFDNYFYESRLHEEELVEKSIQKLKESGHTFMEGGALWFKSQAFGDDKNRVLIKENGDYTYFASDIAYHVNKFNRGYDIIINVWGADHHGYIPRLKSALEALELPVGRFEVIIGQLVSLYRGDEPVRMSKRAGEMVTLDELISEIGTDATRFFMTMNSANNRLDFDLELAKKKATDNPVYYVQYAHARICSILRKAQKIKPQSDLSGLDHPSERLLMLKLLSLEDELISAARRKEPHHIISYLKDLAATFHNFYHQCRVLDNPARIILVDATRIVLRNMLNLLKIEAPERM